jgi:hypothetical protein
LLHPAAARRRGRRGDLEYGGMRRALGRGMLFYLVVYAGTQLVTTNAVVFLQRVFSLQQHDFVLIDVQCV